jgi:hypothetical protein
MYDNFPDLFQERHECLDHLFLTIGNGYEWKKGQLVSKEDRPKRFVGQLDENGKAVQRIRSEFYYTFKDRMEKTFGKQECKLYPICRAYSKLLNYPEDIKPDWLAGIKEMYEYIFNTCDGNEFIVAFGKNGKVECKIFEEVSLDELKQIYNERFGS